jgi:hypothetical protein
METFLLAAVGCFVGVVIGNVWNRYKLKKQAKQISPDVILVEEIIRQLEDGSLKPTTSGEYQFGHYYQFVIHDVQITCRKLNNQYDMLVSPINTKIGNLLQVPTELSSKVFNLCTCPVSSEKILNKLNETKIEFLSREIERLEKENGL